METKKDTPETKKPAAAAEEQKDPDFLEPPAKLKRTAAPVKDDKEKDKEEEDKEGKQAEDDNEDDTSYKLGEGEDPSPEGDSAGSLDPEDEAGAGDNELDMAAYFRFRDRELAAERAAGKARKKKRVLGAQEEEKGAEAEEAKEEKKSEEVRFSFGGPKSDAYSFLCPYADAPFTVRGTLYRTIQHYYQVRLERHMSRPRNISGKAGRRYTTG